MSGIDPAALAAIVTLSKDAMLQATLDLGVPAETLRAKIHVGDLLAAKVLPPEHGQDFIELLGQRVSAQLPPEVHPGETLVLQVTAFKENQIVVRSLGLQDPANPVPVSDAQFVREPAPAAEAARAQPQPRAPVPPQASPTEPPPAQAPPAQAPRNAAPREVFAAASVRPALQKTPQPAAVAQTPPGLRQVARTIGDLLRSVKFPDTPLTRTIAAVAPQAPARIAPVLARLEAALPHESADARIATLKTIIGFVARIAPQNAETLPAQIAGYVSHVVEGPEPKMQQMLQALAQLPAAPPQPKTVTPALEQPAAPEKPEPTPAPVVHSTVVHARAAERGAAADHNLKSVVLSLLRDPPAERTPALMQALNETFITLTATQLNTLSANTQTPGTLAFTLPVFFHEGGKPAQLRISREGASRASKLDAENFHVAFVLDTAHLGTVAIDLQTTARSVKIDVKTEHQAAASRFSETLGKLRERLEHLRYRVASAAAAAAPAQRVLTAPPPRADRNGLDFHA
jgi:hypothetical protein